MWLPEWWQYMQVVSMLTQVLVDPKDPGTALILPLLLLKVGAL